MSISTESTNVNRGSAAWYAMTGFFVPLIVLACVMVPLFPETMDSLFERGGLAAVFTLPVVCSVLLPFLIGLIQGLRSIGLHDESN